MDSPADHVDADFVLLPSLSREREQIEDAAKRWFPDGSERLDKYALSQLAEYKLATVKKCIELMSGGGVFPIVKKLEAGEDGKSVQDAVVIFTDENDKVLPFERWRDSRKLNRLLAFWVLNLFLIYDMYSSVSDF